MKKICFLPLFFLIVLYAMAQPEVPVDQWTGKTILLIGAHPDDDTYSQGTLAMLQEHGNEIYIVTLTTGNVGTQDTTLSMTDLALIRKQEELAALKELGIPGDHYINLGYDDGMLEYQNKKDVVAQLVYQIRKIRPDVLFAFDPGKGCQRWHKADHRAASYLTADAARAAMWPLLFQGQITVGGVKAYTVPAYMFYDSDTADINTWVDISKYVDKKINAMSKYVSQWSSGWYKYTGPVLSPEEEKKVKENLARRIKKRNGVAVEGFRYYKGLPDGIGR